jgi:hypothetical protein
MRMVGGRHGVACGVLRRGGLDSVEGLLEEFASFRDFRQLERNLWKTLIP